MLKVSAIISLLCLLNTIESARILGVFPAPSISHTVVFRALTEELAKRGHELTVITPDPKFKENKGPRNFTEIDVRDVSYKVWNDMLEAVKGESLYKQLQLTHQMLIEVVKVQLETPQVKEFISKKQKFDLIIIETGFHAALGYSYKFRAPVILLSSFYGVNTDYEILGAPTHMFLYPPLYKKKVRNLTLIDKIKDVIIHFVIKYGHMQYEKQVTKLLKSHFGEDTPALEELQNNVEMLFVNINSIWEGNRPVPSSVVYLGQLHVPPVKDLPKDLKSYLDSSRGVIYVSFGSNFSPSTLSEDKIRLLLTVFSKLPYDILCKWDVEDLPGQPSNMKIAKWLPQVDLLRHPNTKVFITQGGVQSTDEAIVAGVPLIGMPLRLDQFFNTDKYVQHKIGEKLDWDTLTEEQFYTTILKVVEDESYRQNMLRLRTLMADQPQSSLERAVWWTEHVLRHGGARHLRAPAANMGWAEYLELPLLATLACMLVVVLAIILGVLWVVAKLVRHVLGFNKLKKD